MRNVLTSEWIKLRSVSSTRSTLAVAASMIVLGAAWTWYVRGLAEERGSVQAAAPEEGFLPLLQICLGVLGVLAVTAERETGFLAVPRRRVLLLAKAAVVAGMAFAAAAGILVATHALSRLIAGDRSLGFEDAPLSALPAAALSATVVALAGLGLGAVTRSTAGGIASVVGVLFVLPGVVAYLPSPWNTRVGSLLLPNLAPQIAGERISRRLGDGLLPPAVAVAVLLGYGVLAVGAALVSITRRDV
ncbi:hypothetical protein [Thermoactinospora rubra]|uniref:hypothetical protein n=1 Tax=Thermoactinospora rubra TaxID=1088767 RepID=UPI000A0F6FE0|nr:hypothetical protein [Thermoactinospora rubra]